MPQRHLLGNECRLNPAPGYCVQQIADPQVSQRMSPGTPGLGTVRRVKQDQGGEPRLTGVTGSPLLRQLRSDSRHLGPLDQGSWSTKADCGCERRQESV